MNNFERIKNMSIEELAYWLTDFVYYYTTGNLDYNTALEVLSESEEE